MVRVGWFYFVCFIFVHVNVCFAQAVYEVDTLYPVHSLDHVLRVYPDTLDTLTPKQVLRDYSSAYYNGDQLPRYLDVGTTYWGKLTLRSDQPLEGWTLHFEDKMIGPPAWTKGNGKVDVYGYLADELIFHYRTGAEYSKAEKDYKGYWMLNAVPLDRIPVEREVHLVIKVRGNSMGYPAYFNLTARGPDQPYYHQIYQYHNSFNIFMLGVTFIIFLYHLLLYVYLREPIYLWFCLWLLFCTLTQAMTVGLIIGDFFNYRYALWFVIANGIFYSFWFFGRVFVDSKKKFPVLDKVILGLALFTLTEIVVMLFYIVFAHPQTYFTGVGMHYGILMGYTVVSLVVSILLAVKKDLFARYFGIGSVVGTAALILGTLWSMGLIVPPFRLDPFVTGMFLQITIYSFGIAYRRQRLAKVAEQERLDAQLSRMEMLRVKELNAMKTRFFTNISHEFRTPLTLIQGPIQEAAKKGRGGDRIVLEQRDFDVVHRNSERLQHLVDELLELSRLETGRVQLMLKKGSVTIPIKTLVHSFDHLAERLGIRYRCNFPQTDVQGYLDAGKLEKILGNLVSNAFKYTQKGGSVDIDVECSEKYLWVTVTDSGKGISEKDIPHIFDRFYRVEGSEQKGSGIGLALAKELVGLYKGRLTVESKVGLGSTFSLQLPLTLEAFEAEATHVALDPRSDEMEGPPLALEETDAPMKKRASERPVVLVVEDNGDLRNYIESVLKDRYRVLLAKDGEEGIRRAVETIPDAVVTDVMMPKKNGFELCTALKSNMKTSHVPILMLTAKVGQENKLDGLLKGADAYLTKPFDTDELSIRLKNLIGLRERIWARLKQDQGIWVDDLQLDSLDDRFLKKVFQTIRDHLDDSLFSVEKLAEQVGFSRAQLHRKTKALLNMTPNHLIADIRLDAAHQMLLHRTGKVSEVAYAVGFSNLSYFSKSFKRKYGQLPSEV